MVNLRTRIKRVIKFSRANEEKQTMICSAIRNLRPVEFYYRGGFRTVEPFALGVVLTEHQDNLSLLCWQTAGFSDNDLVQGWKLYRVSDMEDLEVQSGHFSGDRPGYAPANLEMVKLICFVQPVIHPVEDVKVPVAPEPPVVRIEVPPVAAYEPPPPPPPPVQVRPIVRVLSHNQLMERFRYAHPQPIPELEAMVWPEPLISPFPEPLKTSPEDAVDPPQEPPKPKIWPDTPVSGLRYQPV